MMKTFVKIKDIRLIKSAIKKYVPVEKLKINIYYSPSRNKVDVETFTFSTQKERDAVMTYLDTMFL